MSRKRGRQPTVALVALGVLAALVVGIVLGGHPRALPGFPDGCVPVGWSNDARSIFVYNPGELPVKIYRLDLASGQKQLWKTLMPADAAGITDMGPILITPDGKSYVYEYGRTLSDLYLVEGIK